MPAPFRGWLRSSMSGGGMASARRAKPTLAIRLFRWLLLTCIIVYSAVCVVVAYYQRSFIYFPRVFTAQHVDEAARAPGLNVGTTGPANPSA